MKGKEGFRLAAVLVTASVVSTASAVSVAASAASAASVAASAVFGTVSTVVGAGIYQGLQGELRARLNFQKTLLLRTAQYFFLYAWYDENDKSSVSFSVFQLLNVESLVFFIKNK